MSSLTQIEGVVIFVVGLSIGICTSAVVLAISRFTENKYFNHMLKHSIKASYDNGYKKGFECKKEAVNKLLAQIDKLEYDIKNFFEENNRKA